MSFGDELRRERELRGISLREVAQATKVNERYLDALERNDFGYLPGGLFNRGFVRAYCEHIGIDAEDMVNAYLLEERAQAGNGGDGTQDRRLLRGTPTPAATAAAPEETIRAPERRWYRRGWFLGLLLAAAVLAAGAYIGWKVIAARGVLESPAETPYDATRGRAAERSREGAGR